MARHLSARVKVGLAAIVVFALQSTSHLLQTANAPSQQFVRAADIRAYERRFRELKDSLPSRAIVGYVSDPTRTAPPIGFQFGWRPLEEAMYAKRFFLTQYVLSPIILVDDTERALVVGNFDPSNPPALHAVRGLVVAKVFGDGVVLFSRTAR